MPIPHPDPEFEARLRSDDLGLPPHLVARLEGRDDLRRALATALRLVWSPETWAARQGEELCRALCMSEPIATEILLSPLCPTGNGPTGGGDRVCLTDGPWLPLALLARLSTEALSRDDDPWGSSVEKIEVRDTRTTLLPPLPDRVRALSIARAPALGFDAPLELPALESLSVTDATCAEPWSSSALGGHRGWVSAIGWHPGGRLAATGGTDGVVRIWGDLLPESTADDSAEDGRTSIAVLEGHARPVVALEWNPRTGALATASPDGTVRIWEVSAGRWRERASLVHAAEVTMVAWSPDGLRLATVSDDPVVRVWGIGKEGWGAEELAGHGGLVQRVAWAPDGVRLASAGGDGTARLWIDGGGGFEAAGILAEHDDWVRALAWSPDGTEVVTGSDDGTARRISVRQGTIARLRKAPARAGDTIRLAGHEGWVRAVTFDRSGTAIATAADDGVLRIYAVAGENGERECAPESSVEHPARITALAPSPAPHVFATGDDDGTLRVVRGIREAAGVEGHGHDGTIGAIAWHPTRTELWTGSADRTARVWRPALGGLGPVWGRLLAAGEG